MPMSPRLLRPISTTHPEAQVWRNAVIANGGTVNGSTLSAVSRFCRSIDAAGIRDRFYRLNLFAGTGLNACLVPLYRGPSRTGTQFGNTTDTNVGPFVSGDYAETGASGGLTGNGSSKYLRTGLNNNDLPQNDAHLSSYERVLATTTFDTSIGSRETNTSGNLYLGTFSVATSYVFTGLETGGTITETNAGAGHYIGCVTGSAASQLYKNGAQSGTSASTTRTPSAREISVFALNTAGAFGGLSNARIGGYSAGLGMTSTEAAAFYTAMQAFQTALGRNV